MCRLKEILHWNAMSGEYDGSKESSDKFFEDYVVADMLDKENERFEAERQSKKNGYADDWTKPPKRY